MAIDAANIVTVNAGSSSIKLAVFSKQSMSQLFNISVSGIGQPVSKLQIIREGIPRTQELYVSDYATASRLVIGKLSEEISQDSIAAIGHRLVHGGGKYDSPVPTATMSESDWELLSRLDPNHTPGARQLISQCARQYPAILQVACFDTSFFHHLPKVATIIPIPKKYYDIGVRRYGFHGLSYTSLLATFRERAGEEAANGRVILAHLGSGASVTATLHGKPIDTTMGFTPASGITMSTRSGDLDPGVFSFLHRQNNMSIDAFDRMVNSESGLLGISGVSGDMSSLLALEHENKDVSLAIEAFIRDIKKAIGGFAALLGGVDSLIFSGGIGEQSAIARSRICHGLEYMGIEINEPANRDNSFLISSDNSRVGVHVIPTDEARVIAEQTIELQQKGAVWK